MLVRLWELLREMNHETVVFFMGQSLESSVCSVKYTPTELEVQLNSQGRRGTRKTDITIYMGIAIENLAVNVTGGFFYEQKFNHK